MEYVGTGHWIFALVFTLIFIIGIIYAYRDDIKKSPWFFKGSSRIVMFIVGVTFTILMLKMLHRAMF